MKEIIIKNRVFIFRLFGAVMLLVSFAIYFWAMPKEVLTDSEIAAANVARMEASILGRGTTTKASSKPQTSPFIEELKNAQKKQVEYLIIGSIVIGIVLIGYSFIAKPKNDSEQ